MPTPLGPSEPRIPVPKDLSPDVQQRTKARNGVSQNVFLTLAHNPMVLDRFRVLGGGLLTEGSLPGRERELVILRVGWRARSEYEFAQHALAGLASGLTAHEVSAIRREVNEYDWSAQDCALLQLVDDLVDCDCVRDSTWEALAKDWNLSELVELLILVGFYRMVSGFLNSAGVQLDEGLVAWPASDSAVELSEEE